MWAPLQFSYFFFSGVVLADGFVANPITSTFSATQPVATMVQAHAQGVGGSPTLVSSPRPSILRKKPATEGWVLWKIVKKNQNMPQIRAFSLSLFDLILSAFQISLFTKDICCCFLFF